MQVEKLQLFF